ncbi:MAG: sulfotransferase, partial [Candidatus Nanoarchaeia archaeon]
MNFTFGGRDAVIDQNLCLLTGITRSGTTFFGKVLGSFSNVEYEFEPNFCLWIPSLAEAGILEKSTAKEFFKANVYELFYNKLFGRYCNLRPSDDSCVLNFKTMSEIENKWNLLKNKDDARQYAIKNQTRLVMKMPNAQFFYGFFREVFPNIKFIHIARHPFDVALSVLKKHWLADTTFSNPSATYARKNIVLDGKTYSVPFWLQESSAKAFLEADEFSRGLIYWRIITETHIKSTVFASISDLCWEFKYEDLISCPEKIFTQAQNFLGASTGAKTQE